MTQKTQVPKISREKGLALYSPLYTISKSSLTTLRSLQRKVKKRKMPLLLFSYWISFSSLWESCFLTIGRGIHQYYFLFLKGSFLTPSLLPDSPLLILQFPVPFSSHEHLRKSFSLPSPHALDQVSVESSHGFLNFFFVALITQVIMVF